MLNHFLFFILFHEISSQCTCKSQESLEKVMGIVDFSFWGMIETKNEPDQMGVVVLEAKPFISLKGCIKVNSSINMLVPNECNITFDLNTIYLVTGYFQKIQVKRKNAVTMQTLEIDPCGWNKKLKYITPEQRYWLLNQPDRCHKTGKHAHHAHKTCPDGSMPFSCNKDIVCNKKKWCDKAHSCDVNSCGGCTPQYFDQEGNFVCNTNEYCSDGSQLSTCYHDPCSIASVQQLKKKRVSGLDSCR